MSDRFLGVTVMTMYFQSEGVDAVLDGLAAAGVNAIATAPAVYELVDALPGEDEAGLSDELPRREPPIDAGAGSVRVLERRLWGRDEAFVRPAPSAPPAMRFYSGLPHQPAAATELTRSAGPLIDAIIDGAHARGMKVYFQLSAVQVPGRREEDMPRLPNGSFPRRRMVQTVSLASEDVRAYAFARARDLLTTYPDVDGLRHDWPEHPPYTLGDAFLDFSDHGSRMATELGFDFEAMRTAADALYERLQRLTDADLARALDIGASGFGLASVLLREPALLEVLRFKAAVTTSFLREMREAMDSVPGGPDRELSPNAFPPPLSLLSGVDYGDASRHVDSINMKLYTMHWPQMIRAYAEELLANNGEPLDQRMLLALLSSLFDFEDDAAGTSLDDYRYPPPDEPHRAGVDAQRRKIAQAHAAMGGRARLNVAVHGYGPLDDFEARLRLAWGSDAPGIWVNRYCYLGPAKIAAIARLQHGTAPAG